MNYENEGGGAFPHQFENVSGANNWLQSQGMSLRDYFAAKAMQSLINGRAWSIGCGPNNENVFLANAAYAMADAMLEARK